MRLFYEKFTGGASNFGDNLNVYLWNELLPGMFDDDDETTFIGIGTILNDELPSKIPLAHRRIIFSSGVGYGGGPLVLAENDKVYCVRGPLSAQALGLPSTAAVSDGALLIKRFALPPFRKTFKFSFMPHITGVADEAWTEICSDLGFGYIDPRSSIADILRQINETEVVLAEAMHGAIAADVLRVPWIPIATTSNVLAFKWQDWCASVDLPYAPQRIHPVSNCRHADGDPLAPLRRLRYNVRSRIARNDLARVSRSAAPVLSREPLLESLTCELEARLEQFRTDFSRNAK
ncbi:MAG: polysaccharide pyruvyl transferase family protein [Capsulimonadaceae bacterium]|nr:polysaccharide pyruvyl transferase family protein [Capsulimonadaceae bacterium]